MARTLNTVLFPGLLSSFHESIGKKSAFHEGQAALCYFCQYSCMEGRSNCIVYILETTGKRSI
jgi:hypothetical protein